MVHSADYRARELLPAEGGIATDVKEDRYMAADNEQESAGASSGLSRRAFLGRGAGAALALGLPAAFSSTPVATAAYRRRTALRKGGLLRVGSADQETGLSPWKDALANYVYFNQFYGQPLRDF